jgi:hypothetical protein
MQLAAFKSAIRTWAIRELTVICGKNMAGFVIDGNQSKPRPKFPYASIQMLAAGVRVGGIDEMRYNEEDEEHEQHGTRTTTVSINVFGANANDILSRLRDSLDWPAVIDEFSVAGISHLGESGPMDMTAFEETKDIERSQLDLMLSYSILRTPSVEAPIHGIEQVDLEYEDAPSLGDIDISVGEAD